MSNIIKYILNIIKYILNIIRIIVEGIWNLIIDTFRDNIKAIKLIWHWWVYAGEDKLEDESQKKESSDNLKTIPLEKKGWFEGLLLDKYLDNFVKSITRWSAVSYNPYNKFILFLKDKFKNLLIICSCKIDSLVDKVNEVIERVYRPISRKIMPFINWLKRIYLFLVTGLIFNSPFVLSVGFLLYYVSNILIVDQIYFWDDLLWERIFLIQLDLEDEFPTCFSFVTIFSCVEWGWKSIFIYFINFSYFIIETLLVLCNFYTNFICQVWVLLWEELDFWLADDWGGPLREYDILRRVGIMIIYYFLILQWSLFVVFIFLRYFIFRPLVYLHNLVAKQLRRWLSSIGISNIVINWIYLFIYVFFQFLMIYFAYTYTSISDSFEQWLLIFLFSEY